MQAGEGSWQMGSVRSCVGLGLRARCRLLFLGMQHTLLDEAKAEQNRAYVDHAEERRM